MASSALKSMTGTRDLPPVNLKRWLPRHKAQVVEAVSAGVLNPDDARARYGLTAEEFSTWQEIIHRNGVSALSARQMQERRKSSRRKLREPAVAVLGPEVSITCVITDISARGARVELDAEALLPPVFELRCARSGRSLRVYQVWQRERMVGVSFDTAAPLAIEAGVDTWLLGERS